MTYSDNVWQVWTSWTPDERIVFSATVTLKAGYAGDKDSRFHEAERNTEITRDEWDAAKVALIERGIFNRGGAVKSEFKKAYYKDSHCGHPSVSRMSKREAFNF